jgi:hypothetical protein
MSGKLGSSSFGVLLVDGYDVLAAKLQAFTHKVQAQTVRVDGLGDTWEKNSPTGTSVASLTQTGAFFDDTLNGIHDALKASTDVLRVVCWAIAGNTIGARAFGTQGAFGSSYGVLGTVGNLTKADVTYTVTGQLDAGAIVMNQAAQTANWTGAAVDYTLDSGQRVIPITSATKANPCVVTTPVPHGLVTGQKVLISGNTLATPNINSDVAVTVLTTTTFSVAVDTTLSTGAGTGGSFVRSSTVNGAAGIQAISAYAGFTGVVGKIQHSADNSAWTDLITFTNVTNAPVAERLTVTGTINRYTRHVGTVTGTGSMTPFSVLARS